MGITNFLKILVGSQTTGIIPQSSSASLVESLSIPEPTRSLLWITDEDPSLIQSATAIEIVIKADIDGVNFSEREKGFYAEPSLIWTKLPIESNDELVKEAMYWPAYSQFYPKTRYQYLNWLRDITQPTNLSYVFLYFYGLERHMLIGDYDSAVDEIIRLLEHHKSDSFKRYAITSLIVASIARRRMDIMERVPTILEEESDEALFLRIVYKGSLSPDDVISMSNKVGFTNKRYINKYPELFRRRLRENIENFEKQYGKILSVFSPESFRREERSVFANRSIPEEYRIVKVPQVLNNTKFRNSMKNLLVSTHAEIKEELKKQRGGKNTSNNRGNS